MNIKLWLAIWVLLVASPVTTYIGVVMALNYQWKRLNKKYHPDGIK